MTYEEIEKTVKETILQISEEQELGITEVKANQSLVEELGFASLDVATLVAHLETNLGVDPFRMNIAVITELQTVTDITKVYEKGLQQAS